jgi:hypothetical protein
MSASRLSSRLVFARGKPVEDRLAGKNAGPTGPSEQL